MKKKHRRSSPPCDIQGAEKKKENKKTEREVYLHQPTCTFVHLDLGIGGAEKLIVLAALALKGEEEKRKVTEEEEDVASVYSSRSLRERRRKEEEEEVDEEECRGDAEEERRMPKKESRSDEEGERLGCDEKPEKERLLETKDRKKKKKKGGLGYDVEILTTRHDPRRCFPPTIDGRFTLVLPLVSFTPLLFFFPLFLAYSTPKHSSLLLLLLILVICWIEAEKRSSKSPKFVCRST